jgi:shikimate dehydrogenase
MTYSKKGINGLQMLMIQALKSEEIWFNREMELTDELYLKLKEVLSHE